MIKIDVLEDYKERLNQINSLKLDLDKINEEKEYEKNIKALKDILKGKEASLLKNLEKEMIRRGKEENFEEAIELRKKAEKIKRVFENAFSVLFNNPGGIINFGVTAFTHASTPAKIFGVAVAVFLALVIRRITQGLLRLILVRENYFGKIEK